MLCRESALARTYIMNLLTNIFLLVQHLSTTLALRVIDNGMGPAVYGAEDKMVDYAILAADQKAALPSQVCRWTAFAILHDPYSAQFTICSSATAEAVLSTFFFVQLLRESGQPWVTLQMTADAKTGSDFRVTVYRTSKDLNINSETQEPPRQRQL